VQLSAAFARHVPPARLLLAGIALLLLPRSTWGWGCRGHQIVALIADKQLTAEARAGVESLIGDPGTVTDIPRSCSTTGLPPIAHVSTWADDVRNARPDTGAWHFLDIPRGATAGPATRFCPTGGCVVSAIEAQRRILANERVGARGRAEALMYVIHFIGDIHQPLHAATNRDRGGNCVPVDFFGRAARPDRHAGHGVWHPNLHQVWDTDLLERAMGTTRIATYAARLDARFASRVAEWQHGTAAEWAWETHAVADDVAYGRLPQPLPTEPGDVGRCDERGTASHWRRFHVRLGSTYQSAAAAAIDTQLARAGARLAMILNQAFSTR